MPTTTISAPVGSATTCLLRARAGRPGLRLEHIRIAMVRYGATSSRLSFQLEPQRKIAGTR